MTALGRAMVPAAPLDTALLDAAGLNLLAVFELDRLPGDVASLLVSRSSTAGLVTSALRLFLREDAAFEHHQTLDAINAGMGSNYSTTELLERLPTDAKNVLQAAVAGDDFGRAMRVLNRMQRLLEVSAPTAMIDGERRALRALVEALCPLPTSRRSAATRLTMSWH